MKSRELIASAIATGLESNDFIVEVGEVGDAENTIIEVEELYNEVASTAAEVSRLESAAKALDDMVEAGAGESTFSSDAAVKAVAVEALVTSLGMEAIGLEDIKETALRVWESIKAFIKKLIEKIADFFGSIFTGFKQVLKRAENLRVAANTAKEDKEGEISNSVFVTNLAYNGKLTPVDIIHGLDKSADVISQTFIEVKRCAGSLAVDLAKAGIDKQSQAFSPIGVRFTNTYKSEKISGGYSVEPSIGNINLELFFAVKHEPLTGDHKVSKAKRADVKTIASHVEDICKVVLSKSAVIQTIRKTYDEILNKTDKIMKDAGKGVIVRGAGLAQMSQINKLALSNYSKALADISKAGFNISRAALLYGEKSLA